jgi:hypothetical protein
MLTHSYSWRHLQRGAKSGPSAYRRFPPIGRNYPLAGDFDTAKVDADMVNEADRRGPVHYDSGLNCPLYQTLVQYCAPNT